LIKEALHYRRGLGFRGTSFGKWMPHDVNNIMPPLLSEWTVDEPMFLRFHRLWATMKAIFVNLCQDFLTPLIYSHSLMDDQPKKPLLCLSFVPYDIPLRGSWGGNFVLSLMWNRLLEGLLLSDPFPLHLCQICKEGSNL